MKYLEYKIIIKLEIYFFKKITKNINCKKKLINYNYKKYRCLYWTSLL
jgi:hypothetical protein